MVWFRPFLVILLVLLLQAFSFNAYACLLPMPPIAESADMRDCPSSQEQAPRLVCDAFTTMGVPTTPEVNPTLDSQALYPEAAIWVAPPLPFAARIRGVADCPAVLPQEVLVSTIVLRL